MQGAGYTGGASRVLRGSGGAGAPGGGARELDPHCLLGQCTRTTATSCTRIHTRVYTCRHPHLRTMCTHMHGHTPVPMYTHTLPLGDEGLTWDGRRGQMASGAAGQHHPVATQPVISQQLRSSARPGPGSVPEAS